MSNNSPRHHLLIAGQGRSGTSLLVRILSACGLNTHLEQHGERAQWFDAANAGLEDSPFGDEAPYVIKTPLAYQFIEGGLAHNEFVIDHVIIPVRPLRDAAASRVITEMADMASRPILAEELDSSGMRDHRGTTPGGVVYSIAPLDVERILATGFTRLIEVLVRHDVPMTFLDFPRFVSDVGYLHARLSPVIGDITLDDFRSVTADIVDESKVRVGSEKSQARDVDANEVAALRRAAAQATAARQKMAEQSAAFRQQAAAERRRLNQQIRVLQQKIAGLTGALATPPKQRHGPS